MGLCKKITILVVLLISISVGLFVKKINEVPEPPHLPADAWWGQGEPRKVDESIRPFKIQVPEQVITDLNQQLDRWLSRKQTPPLENQGFQYGFNTDYLKQIVKHWRNNYNWSQRQTLLNKYPQYKTNVNGLEIHFIRVTPNNVKNKRILPLLLLHGWPGSVREFYDVIPKFTTPREDMDFVFELIIPSLPGYGFSEGAARPGLGATQMGVVMNNLMKRIGFEKYYVQGGDWGSMIGKAMGTLYPKNVSGGHFNMCFINSFLSNLKRTIGAFYPPLVVEKEHEHLMYPFSKIFMYIMEESGYMHLQATKPDTIGTALKDTPVGLAAYILEKFSTWTNPDWKKLPDGGLTKKFKLDDVLDNIMIYWVTGSITTSQRLYAENFNIAQFSLQMDEIPIKIPTACARYHNDLAWLSESLLKDQYTNLVQVTDFKDGGHFAAFELPAEFSEDVWSAFQKMEKLKQKVITDLNQQLDRWLSRKQTPPLENQGFQYGFNTDYLKQIVKHWRNNYNWSQRQTLLNKYPQYKTNVNGLEIHFIRVTPNNVKNKRILPLLLLHGWPGSVREFYDVIPKFTTPREDMDFVFELIIPSLPGYGFSEGAARPGLGATQMGVVMNNLMKRIGFEKYYVQGGDWGSAIARTIAILNPDRVLGVHTNMCNIATTAANLKRLVGGIFPWLFVEEKFYHLMYPLSKILSTMIEETGYFHLQATKPDTIGVLLNDSPVGLAAYILEKFSSGTNMEFRRLLDGGLTRKFQIDTLLDNVMIYWVTNTSTTSVRLYAETLSSAHRGLGMGDVPVRVPSACARYHHDIVWLPESIIKEIYVDLVQLTDIENGGHFAALEMPTIFSDDVWFAITAMEKKHRRMKLIRP